MKTTAPHRPPVLRLSSRLSTRTRGAIPGLLLALTPGPPASAQQATPFSAQESLTSLLQKGELTLVESRPDSRLKQVTAIALVQAPPEVIWSRLTDYLAYPTWMPKVGSVREVRSEGNVRDMAWVVEVPGPDYRYTARNTENREHWVLEQRQIDGALRGSHWRWQLIPLGESTQVYRTVFTNVTDESWLARQLDDETHTLSYGINVSTSLVEIRALKRVVEAVR